MKRNAKEKLLGLFFQFPLRVFHIREISRLLKLSPPAVSRAIKQLENDRLAIRANKKKIAYEVQANILHSDFKNLKRIYNLESIFKSKLYDYLLENFPFNAVILFGSYSKGEDSEKSDIDIAIDSKGKKLELEDYEKKLNRRINVEFVDFKKISDELKDSIINGIVLSGYISLK